MNNIIKNDNQNEKILLNLGMILVLFSSVLFGFVSWGYLSNFYKIIFLTIEMILLLILSFSAKKINNNIGFISCYFLSTILLPIILFLIRYYNFAFLSFYSHAGLYIYLSLISFLTYIIYSISLKFIKINLFTFFKYISFLLFLIFLIISFPLTNNYTMLIVLLLFLLLKLICNKKMISNSNFLQRILDVSLIIMSLIIIIYLNFNKVYKLTNLFIIITYLLNILSYPKKSFLKNINPILVIFTVIPFFYNTFSYDLSSYFIFLTLLLIYLFSYFYKSEFMKIISFIFLSFFVLFLTVIFDNHYKLLLIVYVISLCISILLSKKEENIAFKNIFKILIPINTFMITFSIFKIFIELNISEIFLISSVIVYIINLVNKNKINTIFYIFFLCYSTFLLINYNSFDVVFILNIIVWFYYLVMNNRFNKDKKLNGLFFIGLLFSVFSILNILMLSLVYKLLGVSIILYLYYEIMKKKKNIFLIIGSIFILLSVFQNITNFYILFCLILLYVYTFYNLKNIKKINVYKIIYKLLGFLLIKKIILFFIKPIVIVNIILFMLYCTILIIMYLSEKESNKKLMLYSLVLFIPYYSLVDNVGLLLNIKISMYILPFIFYSLIIPFIFNIKDKYFSLIFCIVLSLFTLNSSIYSVVLSIILFIIYLLYGLNFNNYFIYFSIVYLIISLTIGLYTVLNSLLLVILIMLLGLGLILFSIIKRGDKNEIKK